MASQAQAQHEPDSAEARVAEVIEAVDQAQRALERAVQRLAPVAGMVYETRTLDRLRKEAMRAWYLVNGRRAQVQHTGGLRLDEQAHAAWMRARVRH
jgi:hypothetical protein